MRSPYMTKAPALQPVSSAEAPAASSAATPAARASGAMVVEHVKMLFFCPLLLQSAKLPGIGRRTAILSKLATMRPRLSCGTEAKTRGSRSRASSRWIVKRGGGRADEGNQKREASFPEPALFRAASKALLSGQVRTPPPNPIQLSIIHHSACSLARERIRPAASHACWRSAENPNHTHTVG